MSEVEVYFDSIRKLLSIRDWKSKRVVGKATTLHIYRPKFHVSEAGRQRVLKTGKKNVHAFISGRIINNPEMTEKISLEHYEQFSYNPFKGPYFYSHETNLEIGYSSLVYLNIIDKKLICLAHRCALEILYLMVDGTCQSKVIINSRLAPMQFEAKNYLIKLGVYWHPSFVGAINFINDSNYGEETSMRDDSGMLILRRLS